MAGIQRRADRALIHLRRQPAGLRRRAGRAGVLEVEGLAAKAERNGEYLMRELRLLAQDYPDLIMEVRGVGLMIGLEMRAPDISQLLIANLIEHGVLVAYTLNRTGVIRLEPPLVMEHEMIRDVLGRMRTGLEGTRQVLEQSASTPPRRAKLMGEIVSNRTIPYPARQVFNAARDVERFPDVLPNVDLVKVLEDDGQGRPLRVGRRRSRSGR